MAAGTAVLAATIEVAGEVYERLDALAKELVDKKQPPEDKRYYKAHIDKASNVVYISQNSISFEEAKVMMNMGIDLYTPIKDDAFELAKSAGGEPSIIENHGKKNKKSKKRIKPGIYYSHYHPWHRRCHIFFDKPTIVYAT